MDTPPSMAILLVVCKTFELIVVAVGFWGWPVLLPLLLIKAVELVVLTMRLRECLQRRRDRL